MHFNTMLAFKENYDKFPNYRIKLHFIKTNN